MPQTKGRFPEESNYNSRLQGKGQQRIVQDKSAATLWMIWHAVIYIPCKDKCRRVDL